MPDAPAELVTLASQCWEHALAAAQRHADANLADQRAVLVALQDDLANREAVWQEQIHQHTVATEQARQSLIYAINSSLTWRRVADLPASSAHAASSVSRGERLGKQDLIHSQIQRARTRAAWIVYFA